MTRVPGFRGQSTKELLSACGELFRGSTYAWCHLLPTLGMLLVVCLREDVVASVFDTGSMIVPIRSLVARVIVHMRPYFRRRCNKHTRGNSGNRPWVEYVISLITGGAYELG